MALPTITLVNLTVGDIDLVQLAVTVPGSGNVIVSDFNFTDEILNDEELQTELDAGNLRIDIVGGGLSSSDTTKTLEQSKAIIKPIHDLDIKHNLAGTVAPVATDDENAGYSVGSIWVDETGDAAYICVDATATAAVWNPMGGAATWAATLAAGQISGGTDAVMSVGDTFRGVDSTTTTGGALAIRGGDTTFAGLVNGGDVTIDGGDCGGTSGFVRGGNITITGGIPATNGSGGSVNIFGATPLGFNGTGGAVFITSGEGATGGGNANGGSLSILTGDGKISGQGGPITIACGDSPSFGLGADLTLTAGLCTGGSGQGGDLNLNAGAGSEVGGDVFITAGAKTVQFGSPNNTGNVVIKSGAAAGVNGVLIGSITLQTPDVNDVAALNRSGAINLITGNGGLSNSDAGHLNITLGNAQDGANNQAGSVFVICGDDVQGTSSSKGGEFSVVCGDTDIGTGGGFDVVCGGSTGASGIGGSVAIIAGHGGSSSGANGDITFGCQSSAGSSSTGGSILGLAGDGGGTGVGGAVSWTAGAGGTTNSVGGLASLTGGASTGTASGGAVNVVGGAAGATGVQGGKVSVVGGAGGVTSGDGGVVAIAGGSPTDGDGGAVNLSGADGVGTNRSGGTADVIAGDSTGTATGAIATIQAGEGGATGNGGKVNVIGGAGGATSGNGGAVGISSGVPTDGDGGTIGLIASAGVGVNRSGGTITLDAGNSTGTANGAAISITAGDGSASSVGGAVNITGGDGRTGGDVVIRSGGPIGALEAGDVRIIADKAGGVAGKITLTTESDDTITAPVAISTQSGFVDQAAEHRTFASSTAITNGVTNQVIVNLGSIVTNGHNLKVVVDVTATDSITDSNFVAYRFVGSFYRAGGTVTAVTAFEDTNFLAGTANWTSNISFHVAISGGTVRLELDNAGGSGTDNFNLAIGTMSVVQLGGRTA